MSLQNTKGRTLFYCIAGSGMGNSSRLEAVVESLESANPPFCVRVFCWGRSYAYLNQQFSRSSVLKIYPLLPYVLPIRGGPFDTVISIVLIPFLFSIYILNNILLLFYVLRWNPQYSVHDSDYHYLPFLLLCKKRVAISQSAMVVRNSSLLKNENLKTKINYFLFEYLEYLFTMLFASKVFCPSWDTDQKNCNEKLQNIAPVVRKVFRISPATPTKDVAVFSGGSGIQTRVLEKISKQLDADLYTYSPERGGYSIRGSDGSLLLSRYKAVVVQAGHVLISESFALRKIIYPVPIDNHPEQIVNTKLVHRLFGRSEVLCVKDLDRLDFVNSCPKMEFMACDGADSIASYLLEKKGTSG